MRIIRSFLLLLIFFLVITACANEKREMGLRHLINNANVTKIELINGMDGARTSIVDSENINKFMDLFEDVDFKLKSNQKKRTGYLYSFTLYNAEKKINSFALISNNLISNNQHTYEVIGSNNLKDSLPLQREIIY